MNVVGDTDSESLVGCLCYCEGDSNGYCDGDSSTELPEAVLVMVFALAMGMLTAVESIPVSLAKALTSSRAQAWQRSPWTRTEDSDVD